MAYKYTPPKWLGCIPQGTHGSSIIQKKYWKVVSDFVRIRDFEKYGTCISCGLNKPFERIQAGHYKSWASCRGYSKWDTMNIFGECDFCNTGFNSNEVGAKFRDGIIKRYGQERIDYIESLSSYPTEKLEDHVIVDKIKSVILDMSTLKAKPDYYEKILNHKEWNSQSNNIRICNRKI